MNELTIGWVIFPFVVGFSIYLLPKIDRYLAIFVSICSLIFGFVQIFQPEPYSLKLLGMYGVDLLVDDQSGYFILTNAAVAIAVTVYCWKSAKSAFFFTQLVVLQGALNAVFVCADLISLYVALEAISIAAFLLMTYQRTDRSIWIGLRYLFLSNTAMLFYLIGAVLVYQATKSFAFVGLAEAPSDAIALIFLGLLTKGGVFVSGLWLPLTHSEAETPVSAMLSGVVVKAGIFPLLRCGILVPDLDLWLRLFGLATALLGIIFAILETDAKRLLAFSTISKLGLLLSAPAVAGLAALSHGLVKSSLFLMAGQLPTRNFQELRQTKIASSLWLPLAIACLSMVGMPLLVGFSSKALLLKNIAPWQAMGLNIAAVGTALAFAKFLFIPHDAATKFTAKSTTFWGAIAFLFSGVILGNGFYLEAYQLDNIPKALIKIAIGWALYWLIMKRIEFKLPRIFEAFEQLIGAMSVVLTGLFWMVTL
ncbi:MULTISPECIES: cation:proton antiporter [Cyanophyceae]|uniref:cation:proton antiporter n=1 Tax=Cyanophyceae TaxID=3028117 RepID=UPI00000B15E1|nr:MULTISPECIES: cation:proton antiporter [Cyanophyceae]AAN03548.1 MnhD2 [Picosynechococcus sp. PCC 7002]ACB00353.1 Multisubunit Na+/H+ antiporter, subunit D2 [Picosynechococcus sp. PCC 7002]SMH48675.1 multisubunit sodium/proton antiporter, MrpD subunit [Picosynechococcus sp. OG1]SMQ81391.1 multisubunit sodium/proton antiporter, MrpD subunit [Synechococcus sp. 7002]